MFNLEYTPFVWPLLISLIIIVALGVYALRHRPLPVVTTFAWLMGALGYWTLCYVMELSSTSFAGKSFWLAAKYPGSTAGPVLWFVLSLRLTRHEHWLSRPVRLGLALFAISTCLVVFTNNLHHWFWTDIRVVAGFPETETDHGFYFWIYVAAVYGFVLTSVALFFHYYRSAPSYYRRQAALLAFGGFVPLGGRILEDLFGIDPFPKVDNVIVLLLLSSLCFAIAIFRYGALNIIHIAHTLVISNIRAAIIVLDSLHRVVDLNPYAQELGGLGPSQAIGKPLDQALPSWPHLPVEVGVEREIAVQRGGEPAYYTLQSSHIREADGTPVGYVLVLFDITARKRAEQELERLARTDALTGITNRRYFFELAQAEWAKAQRYAHDIAVIMLDIDHFKQVNDQYGHDAGDTVLTHIATECQRLLRTTDLFARYGGEEFICLVSEGGREAALHLAERLRAHIDQSRRAVNGREIHVTLSLGVASVSSAQIDSLDDLITRADQALYSSKSQGRNRVTVAGALERAGTTPSNP